MKILVWNWRGDGNANFYRNFFDIICNHRPSIAVILETCILGDRANAASLNLGFDNVCYSNANGFSGGIWELWNSWDISLDILSVTDQTIHAFVQVSVSIPSSNWIFITVYASPILNTCLHLWENLSFFASSDAMPWLLAGNFNDGLGNYENLNYSPPNQNGMSMFNNLLNNCNLLDLSINGPRFT